MIDPLLLATLVASRVCHDLAQPITSITTSQDFMREPPGSPMREEADKLFAKAAVSGPAKVLFLRYAFGSQGLSNTVANLHEAKQITEDYAKFRNKPSTMAWDLDTMAISYAHVRLMMQMTMLGFEATPKGGVIHARIARDGSDLAFTIRAKGQRARLSEDVANGLKLQEPEDGWKAEKIQPAFAQCVAQSLGSHIAGQALNEEEVVFQASGVRPADEL